MHACIGIPMSVSDYQAISCARPVYVGLFSWDALPLRSVSFKVFLMAGGGPSRIRDNKATKKALVKHDFINNVGQ